MLRLILCPLMEEGWVQRSLEVSLTKSKIQSRAFEGARLREWDAMTLETRCSSPLTDYFFLAVAF